MKLFYFAQGPVAPALFCSTGHITHPVLDSDDSQVCADGNASDNWDAPPAGGWSFYDNGLRVCASVRACVC